MNEILTQLQELFVKHGYTDKVPEPTDNLKDDLGLDSLGILTMVDELEEKHDIFLDPSDMADPPVTVGDLINLVNKKIAQKD